LEWRSVTEWHEADEQVNRDRIDRARQAAEALFRPTRGDDSDREPPAATGDGTGSTEPQTRRQPRIFSVPPRLPPTAEAERPAEPKVVPRKPVRQRRGDSVPSSQIGRVRALTTYGMTPAEVAELYGVTVDAIERILAGPTAAGKSR
jgi:hypothetical protein